MQCELFGRACVLGMFVVLPLAEGDRVGVSAGTWVNRALTSSIDALGWTSMSNVRLVKVLILSCMVTGLLLLRFVHTHTLRTPAEGEPED